MEINYPNEGMPKLPPFKSNAVFFILILLMIISSGFGSVFYQIGPDEVGVVQRFGKYMRTENPGLRWRFPQTRTLRGTGAPSFVDQDCW